MTIVQFLVIQTDISANFTNKGAQNAMKTCKNCGRKIKSTSETHAGFGAGSGEMLSGVEVCPLCNEGCYKWEKDDIPGFRSKEKWLCCKCGREP